MKHFLLLIFIFFSLVFTLSAAVWNIGPARTYKFCSQVSSLVADGDTVEIDNATYDNDKQVTWTKNNLYFLGIGGKPILKAGSLIANDNSNGKGIFVIRGNNTTVENIEFNNSKVPDHNGAGIRQEGSNLIVRHCTFSNNEMGILQGGTIPNCTILIEFCKFLNNGSTSNPGYQHNVYINHIDTLIFRFNVTLDAIAEGHELKSRASNNFIMYNRISNLSSTDTRNIDLPNGGTALILGNVIEQGPNSSNSNIIGFGMEGLTNPGPHNLFICSNTIVNRMNKGNFISVAGIDSLQIYNNFFLGAKTGGFLIGTPAQLDSSNNIINDNLAVAQFIDLTNSNFHIAKTSPAINKGIFLFKFAKGHCIMPAYEFVTDSNYTLRAADNKLDIGAFEFWDGNSIDDEKNNDFDNVLIYPNPVGDRINIKLNGTYPEIKSVQIYTVLGQLIKEVNLSQSTSIDISDLQTGIYFLVINNQRKIFVKE